MCIRDNGDILMESDILKMTFLERVDCTAVEILFFLSVEINNRGITCHASTQIGGKTVCFQKAVKHNIYFIALLPLTKIHNFIFRFPDADDILLLLPFVPVLLLHPLCHIM